ncbi:MAG: hypothetical protein J6Y29_04980 [Clostridiales bacterium]|nr:hypothetical protein [Clostridiales bacterium]
MRKMLKQLAALAIIIAIFGMTQSYAKDNLLCTGRQTEQFLVSIARPLQDESTYKDMFKICGSTKMDNIRIRMYIWNENTGTYKALKNSQGETYWDIGRSGVFVKEAMLPKKGVNIVRVCAYDKRQEHKLEVGRNLQVNEFSIIFLNKKVKDRGQRGMFSVVKRDQ